MRITIAAVMLVLLAGCVGTRLANGCNKLLGQDIHAAVARLGYPDGERTMMGDHLYVWSSDRTGLMPVTSLSTTNGYVGNTGFSGTTTNMSFASVRFHCTLQFAVDSSNHITSWQSSGNNGGCAPYANRLN